LAGQTTSSSNNSSSSSSDSNDPRFTTWEPAQYLHIQEWLDPWRFGGDWKILYPTIIDHDSPFGLSGGSNSVETLADGLSYSLVGNSSLHLYFVVNAAEATIVRLPVAWIAAGAPEPPSPFPPPKPACDASKADSVVVAGAGVDGVNGVYHKTNRTEGPEPVFKLDAQHQLYSEHGIWRLAFPGTGTYYVGSTETGTMIPGEGGWNEGGLGQLTPENVACRWRVHHTHNQASSHTKKNRMRTRPVDTERRMVEFILFYSVGIGIGRRGCVQYSVIQYFQFGLQSHSGIIESVAWKTKRACFNCPINIKGNPNIGPTPTLYGPVPKQARFLWCLCCHSRRRPLPEARGTSPLD
jgi:hypothetical protein